MKKIFYLLILFSATARAQLVPNSFLTLSSFGVRSSASASANATAIANCIAAANARSKSVCIDVVATTNTVTVSVNNLLIFGYDSAHSKLSLPSGVSADTKLLNISGSYITILNCALDGNHANLIAATVTKGINLTGNNLYVKGVFFKNFEYDIRAIGSGSNYGIQSENCRHDSVGSSTINLTDYAYTYIINNKFYGWGVNSAAASCITYTQTVAGRTSDCHQLRNVFINGYHSLNFGTETPSSLPIQRFESVQDEYYALGYQMGGISNTIENSTIDQMKFYNSFPNAYAVECSGSNVKYTNCYFEGVFRHGPNKTDIDSNITLHGITFNLPAGSGYDHVVGFGPHQSVPTSTVRIKNVDIDGIQIDGQHGSPISVATIGYYGGHRCYIDGFHAKNITILGNPASKPVIIEMAGYQYNDISFENLIVKNGGTFAQIDTGKAYGLAFKNITAIGSGFDASINSTNAPKYVNYNTVFDSVAANPTWTAGSTSVIGSTGTVIVNGTDKAMQIGVIAAGTAPSTAGDVITVTFAKPYLSAPIVVATNVLSGGDITFAWEVKSVSTTGFILRTPTTLSTQSYSINVIALPSDNRELR